MIRALGGSGSGRETITTGRYLAANPRSAIQTSPGRGFIEEVQNFLLHLARPNDLKETLIGQLDEFGDLRSDPFRRFRAPLLELFVEPFRQDVHGITPSGFWQKRATINGLRIRISTSQLNPCDRVAVLVLHPGGQLRVVRTPCTILLGVAHLMFRSLR
jgi:hypothetical protein